MSGLENQVWLWGLIISNLIAIIFVITAIKSPKVSRLLFFLLFLWASVINWKTSQQKPEVYLEYADLTFFKFYKNFIEGWFSKHISLVIGVIATCQGLIAISMFLRNRMFKLGCIGGILFLFAIAPLGVGSGFPCTLSFAAAMMFLYKKGGQFLWDSIHGIKSSKFKTGQGNFCEPESDLKSQ